MPNTSQDNVARYWRSDSYGNEIMLSRDEFESGSHSGDCGDDIEALAALPHIAAQLAAFDPDRVRRDLRGYGAWDDAELADHQQNLKRWLWIACGDLLDLSDEELEQCKVED